MTLELTLYDPIETAFVAADEISLIKNTYADVVQHGGADTCAIAVPAFTIPAGNTTTQYFWAQTRGPALVWRDGSTFVQGDIVVPADPTADTGQVTILAGTAVAAVLNLVKRRHVGVGIDPGDASDNDYTLLQLELE